MQPRRRVGRASALSAAAIDAFDPRFSHLPAYTLATAGDQIAEVQIFDLHFTTPDDTMAARTC